MSKPRIALRPDSDGTLDDVVVEDVTMFRAEMMDKGELWMCCYLPNDEAITLWVRAKGGRLILEATDVPDYDDWDEPKPEDT